MGYILANILGPLLSILLLLALSSYSATNILARLARQIRKRLPLFVTNRLPARPTLQRIFTTGLTTYFESAVYFAIAIQIATLAITIPKDYETEKLSFGGYEARSCSLVSTICLLPLLYPVAILSLLGEEEQDAHSTSNFPITTSPPTPHSGKRDTQKPSKPSTPAASDISARNTHRLTLFSIAILLSVYPFLSQSWHSWAPTQIGQGKGDHGATYVTDEEWAVLEDVCFGSSDGPAAVDRLSEKESIILGAVHTIASCVVILYTAVGLLLPPCLRRLEGVLSVVWLLDRQRELDTEEQTSVDTNNKHDTSGWILSRIRKALFITENIKRRCRTSRTLQIILFLVPVILAGPLLWGFWRQRQLQGQLAVATGGNDEAGDWGFGQVMAITIFLPVGVEMVSAAFGGGGSSKEEEGNTVVEAGVEQVGNPKCEEKGGDGEGSTGAAVSLDTGAGVDARAVPRLVRGTW